MFDDVIKVEVINIDKQAEPVCSYVGLLASWQVATVDIEYQFKDRWAVNRGELYAVIAESIVALEY